MCGLWFREGADADHLGPRGCVCSTVVEHNNVVWHSIQVGQALDARIYTRIKGVGACGLHGQRSYAPTGPYRSRAQDASAHMNRGYGLCLPDS
jgi:hypothetical protein